MKRFVLISLLLIAPLFGCGPTQTERTATGAGMGAVLGAGIGSIWHQPGTGALIGAGAGAIGGAVSPQPQGPVYPQNQGQKCSWVDANGYCHN